MAPISKWISKFLSKESHLYFNFKSLRYLKNTTTLDAEDSEYELIAVSVHIGSVTDGGHYIAYTKRSGGRWYLFNDETYEQVKETDVLNLEAYLLFYRKVTL